MINLEPALYEDGVGGVRIEDPYLIAASGAERLSTVDQTRWAAWRGTLAGSERQTTPAPRNLDAEHMAYLPFRFRSWMVVRTGPSRPGDSTTNEEAIR